MNLFLRLFFVLFTGLFRKRLKVLDSSRLNLLVFPNDLDIYGHMNNGRYLTLMDLGRIDWIVRTGLGKTADKNGWKPLVAAVKMNYKKSFLVFQTFELRTRILGWDAKWFFIEQVFEKNGLVHATGIVKGLFRGPDGNVPTQLVLSQIEKDILSPELPSVIQGF